MAGRAEEDGDDTHVGVDRRTSHFLFPCVIKGFEAAGSDPSKLSKQAGNAGNAGIGSWLAHRLSI